jgi:hypothetical protein
MDVPDGPRNLGGRLGTDQSEYGRDRGRNGYRTARSGRARYPIIPVQNLIHFFALSSAFFL